MCLPRIEFFDELIRKDSTPLEEDENAVPADLKPTDFSTKILQLDGFRVELGSVERPVESSATGTAVDDTVAYSWSEFDGLCSQRFCDG